MSRKNNDLLSRIKADAEAKAKAEYDVKLAIHEEIDLIAHLLSCHEDLGVGPGRARKVLNGYLESKMDVAEAIVKETSEDSQGDFWETQRNLALQLRRILGEDLWNECKGLFPMLSFYWDRS